MIRLEAKRLTGMDLTIGEAGIAASGLAFADSSTSCGANPYQYVACGPLLPTAQMYAAIMVGTVVAFAIGWGIHGRQFHTIP